MKNRMHIWEKFHFQGETFPGQALVEIFGENRVLIENHHGVREYSAEKISVNVKYGTIVISGENLNIRYMSAEQIFIFGRIDSVSLIRRSCI